MCLASRSPQEVHHLTIQAVRNFRDALWTTPMKERMHTLLLPILRSQTTVNQSNGFPNAHTQRYHRSHVEAARHFSNAYRVEDILRFWNRIYILPSTRILQILPNTQRTEEHLRATNFEVTNFSAFTKRICRQWRASLRQEFRGSLSERRKEGRKERKKEEKKVGRKKLAGYTGRDGFALSVYVLRSISLLSKRLPLRLHYSGALPCYRGLWPGGMYPGRLPYPTMLVFVGAHAPTIVAFASVCADGVGGSVSAGALRWLLVAASPENTENIEEVRRAEEGRDEDGRETGSEGEEEEKGKGAFPLSGK